ncbi:fused MFS/spermidine synthase [Niveibacterium sp. 24ML]|uniref:fused MFS/spermidine synthase n=1 Tax=Niveibacterium sp. 24ML TaxID=2985512 RepID=UPI00226E74F0|nr:fused MFS/spermidine synthase [Niveibacterium sp. 24ML]MCX9157078.1 fused MFS/spermidine synthase [Niveibacterium sp. 24ML]
MPHSIDVSEEAGMRYLHFGSEWVQGAMRVRRPFALELEYTQNMCAPLLLRAAPWPRNVLLIGLGAGSLTKFFYRNVPQSRITVVEIDARVVAVARAQFKLPNEDARLRIVIADGAEAITRDSGRWDLILVDGFDHNARAGMLDTAPFYAAARAALSPTGVMACNLFGHRKGFRDSFERITQAFDGRALALPACDTGNVVALAHGGEELALGFAELNERAAAFKLETGLDLRTLIKRLETEQPATDGQLHF